MVVLTSFPPPEEGIVHKQEATEAHIQRENMGKGTLFVAESRVSWRNEVGQGFSLEYPAISLHAISRDQSVFPSPCLYLMLDAKLDQGAAGSESNDSGTENEENDSTSKITEVRFVPEDPLAYAMYKAMCDCQALHPDENDSDSDEEEVYNEEGQGDFYSNQDDVQHLSHDGQQTLHRLEQIFRVAGDSALQQQNGHTTEETEQSAGDGQMETAEQFEDADMES